MGSVSRRLAISFVLLAAAGATADERFTIEDYNAALPYWGTSWLSGPSGINGYYPSFYTGFAPRTANPRHLHVRLSRGNQTRVSQILDDDTIRDYLFDLVKRYQFYHLATRGGRPLVNARPDEGTKIRVTPHLSYFNRIIESEAYGILPFVQSANTGGVSAEEIHAKSLAVIKALNPGRVFELRIDLGRAFLAWRDRIRAQLRDVADPATFYTVKNAQTVIALDTLLPGRMNLVDRPTAEILAKLAAVASLAVKGSSDDEFVLAAYDLFLAATGKKYAFRVLEGGRWAKASACESASRCVLAYPELTTIYPTGSVLQTTRDDFGNVINDYSTPGLWNFVSRGVTAVDNIREEPYYGWVPKLDYEAAGNGFHNPAVRFYGPSKQVKELLGIPMHHNTLWSVKRGGVSHGCSRLSSGHAWEMRHMLPSGDTLATQVSYFGHDPRDFDLFDVNGDGREEVMGVEYLISYSLRGTDDAGQREGTDIEIGSAQKFAFYAKLYGEREVFRQASDGSFWFMNPTVSLPSWLDRKDKRIDARLRYEGEFPLWEQAYERDKLQLFLPVTTEGLASKGQGPLSKRIVRLMGRVRGCAPTANKEYCGEAAFDREAKAIFAEAGIGAAP